MYFFVFDDHSILVEYHKLRLFLCGNQEDGVVPYTVGAIPRDDKGDGIVYRGKADRCKQAFKGRAVKAAMFDVCAGAVERAVFSIEIGYGQPAAGIEHIEKGFEHRPGIADVVKGHTAVNQVKGTFGRLLTGQVGLQRNDIRKRHRLYFLPQDVEHAGGGIHGGNGGDPGGQKGGYQTSSAAEFEGFCRFMQGDGISDCPGNGLGHVDSFGILIPTGGFFVKLILYHGDFLVGSKA